MDEPDDRAEWLMIHLTASISRRDEVFGRDNSLAASSQIRMLACVKGLLTHASGIGYTPSKPGKGVALPTLPQSKRDKTLF
jgi:hypothetical protein